MKYLTTLFVFTAVLVTHARSNEFPKDKGKLTWTCSKSREISPLVIQYKHTRTEADGQTQVLYGEACLCKGCENSVDTQVFEFGYGVRVLDISPKVKNHQIEFFYGPGINSKKDTPQGKHLIRAFARREEWVVYKPASFGDIQDEVSARIYKR